MQVLIGNTSPIACTTDDQGDHTGHVPSNGPAVTYVNIPDEYPFDPNIDTKALALHLLQRTDGVTNFPGSDALLAVVHQAGLWGHHGAASPAWVSSDNPAFEALLASFYGCPQGTPAGLEDDYFTLAGPPGVTPQAAADLTALLVNSGRDNFAQYFGGGQVGSVGTGTAAGATSLTNSGASWTSNQWAGTRVFCYNGTAMVYGNVISNTSTVLTIDRWYNPATPGGAAGTTPASGYYYVIADGASPGWFYGLTANSSAPSGSDTSLTGEITTSGGGLIRKIGVYAHTAGTNTYTMTPVFTANGSDSLPVTIAKMGCFNSMVVADTTQTMNFETLLSATATLSASGDTLTLTHTVTTS